MAQLPLAARIYVVTVIAAACPVLVLAALKIDRSLIPAVVILGLLYLVSESMSARGVRDLLSISLGSVTVLAAFPLVGAWGAILVPWTSAFALERHKSSPVKRAFNGGQLVLTAAASGAAYHFSGGQVGAIDWSFPGALWPMLVANVVHCLVNGILVAVVVGLAEGISPVRVFQGTMAHSVLFYLAYGLFGISLAVLWNGVGLGALAAVLLLLPLLVARWAYTQYAEQQAAYDRTVRTLMAAVETKDLYTRGHSERVSAASALIARQVGMREDRVASLHYAGMLHDVGKLGVPTRVLQKSGRLTEDEFSAIQRHPVQGLEIVREIEFLDEALAGIMHHHERIDGLGYPMGLAGDRIPEFARIIAVADAFDSMTTTRSYRGARSIEAAVEELRRCSGTQFDPRFVTALIEAVEAQGWNPPKPATIRPVIDEEPAAVYDHDDPTVVMVKEPR